MRMRIRTNAAVIGGLVRRNKTGSSANRRRAESPMCQPHKAKRPGAFALEVSLAPGYFGSGRLRLNVRGSPRTLASTSGSFAARASVRWIGHCPKAKRPRVSPGAFALEVSLAVTYFRVRNAHYHRRLSVSRSCSGWEGVGPEGYCHQAFRWSTTGAAQGDADRDAFGKSSRFGVVFDAPPRIGAGATSRLRGYRIKPHGQLVPVSLTPYSASTSGLST